MRGQHEFMLDLLLGAYSTHADYYKKYIEIFVSFLKRIRGRQMMPGIAWLLSQQMPPAND